VRDIHAARDAEKHNAEVAKANAIEAHKAMEEAQHEKKRADDEAENAHLAALSADDAKKEYERKLNELKADLKKNINDASALKALAKQVNNLAPEPKLPTTGSLDAGSVSQTGLPP
jgi:hypothetical protein